MLIKALPDLRAVSLGLYIADLFRQFVHRCFFVIGQWWVANIIENNHKMSQIELRKQDGFWNSKSCMPISGDLSSYASMLAH